MTSTIAFTLYEDFSFALQAAIKANERLRNVELMVELLIDHHDKWYSGPNRGKVDPWDCIPPGSPWATQRQRGTEALHYESGQGWFMFNRFITGIMRPPFEHLWSLNPNAKYFTNKQLLTPPPNMAQNPMNKPGMPGQKPGMPGQKPAMPNMFNMPGQNNTNDVWGLQTHDYTNINSADGDFSVAVPPGFAAAADVSTFRPPLPSFFIMVRKTKKFTEYKSLEQYYDLNF